MAIIKDGYTPYYIKSDAIAVFPCANRTNRYASRFTTEYNLTHLGLPNASWISKVADKTTGAALAQGDKISCIINGYFFEFSLGEAYDIDGNQLTFEEGMTLLACIDASCLSSESDPDPVPAAEPSPTPAPASNPDPLQEQAQLHALVTDDTQPQALDKIIEKKITASLFLGLAIFKDITNSIQCSADPLYSLQLASSGNYPYIGLIPPMSDNAVTTNKILNQAITVEKLDHNMFDKQVTTDSGLISQVSVNGTKLEVKISGNVKAADKASALEGTLTESNLPNGIIKTAMFSSDAIAPKATNAQTANKIMVNTGAGLVACTLTFDQTTGTLTLSTTE